MTKKKKSEWISIQLDNFSVSDLLVSVHSIYDNWFNLITKYAITYVLRSMDPVVTKTVGVEQDINTCL